MSMSFSGRKKTVRMFKEKLISKLVVKALKARNADPSVYNFIKRALRGNHLHKR